MLTLEHSEQNKSAQSMHSSSGPAQSGSPQLKQVRAIFIYPLSWLSAKASGSYSYIFYIAQQGVI